MRASRSDADVVAGLGEHLGHQRKTETGQEETVVDIVAGRARLDETDPKPHRSKLPLPPIPLCADCADACKHASGPRRDLPHGPPTHLVRR